MSESKKSTTKPVEKVVTEPVVVAKPTPRKSFRVGAIFWGALFIFVGTLLLLDNLGIVHVNFFNLWQLWPILIIGAGVSMFSLRGWIAGVVSLVLVVTLAGLTLLVAVDNSFYQSAQNVQTKVVTLGDATSATDKGLDLTLKTGAIDLALASSDLQRTFSAEVTSTHLTLNQESAAVRDGVRYVTLATDMTRGWWFGPVDNNLNLVMTERLPLTLHVETGASNVTGDLSNSQLTNMTVKAGASTIDLKFGSKKSRQDITLECGASKIMLRVPTGAGVRVESEIGLSHTDFAGVEKLSNGVYESTNFSSTVNQITIHAKLGVSSFQIVRY